MHLDSKKSNSQLYLVLARPKVHAHHPHHRPKVLQLLFGLGLERGQRFLLLGALLRSRRRRLALLATSGSRASFYLHKLFFSEIINLLGGRRAEALSD